MSANGYVTQECVCACVCVPVCVHPTRCVIRHVVTRGDEESRPRNPLPCVHEEIPKEALKCTRTHTLVLSPPQQAPVALASLPFGPPEDSKKVGADRVRVLLLSGARGFTGIYTPGPENGQDPHSSTLLLLRSRRALGLHRRRRRLGTHREKKWNWFLEGGFSAHASQHASLNTAVMENNYEKTLL